ncbi:hypothetical protein ACS0TY_017074 [Phlomoides rotata]
MILHLLLLLFSHLDSISNAASSDDFSTCLSTSNFTREEIQTLLYPPNAQNYTSILLQNLRNSRFNTSQTRKPTLIFTPFLESQVQVIVKCANKNRLQLKIRSGGHDYEGLSYTSRVPFAILDMNNLRSININIDDQTAWVQSGATLGEIYFRISEKSKVHAFPGGVCPTLGVGGHISGGGYGNMIRKYGLTVDNVVDAKIVDAKGRILDRKGMGEDLFWAIRGGGGASFGVVLSYKIKLVPIPPQVTVFQVFKSLEDNATTDIVHRWQYVADKFDKELFLRVNLGLYNKTAGALFVAMYLGDANKLFSLVEKQFPELGLKKEDCEEMGWIKSVFLWAELPVETPDADLLIRKPPVFQPFKIKSDYVKRPISKEGLRGLFSRVVKSGNISVKFNPYGGRMSEIAGSATPFPHRAGNIYKIQYFSFWAESGAAAEKKNLDDIREIYDYMAPFVSQNPRAAFLNYRDIDVGNSTTGGDNNAYDEGKVYGEKYFKTNFNRLVQVKTKVDPDNFFWYEQSIPTLKK